LGELIAAIEKRADIAASLIVLPEAFNLGREYDTNHTPKTAPLLDERSVLAELSRVAAYYDVIFVASLIETSTRWNSAYFIDAGTPRLMCRKIIDDFSQEYRRCIGDCDGENPIRDSEGLCIAALICADAMPDSASSASKDHKEARQRLNVLRSKLTDQQQVLCVPAYMNTLHNDPRNYSGGLILANSRPGSCSFIKNGDGAHLIRTEHDCRQNQVQLSDLRGITGDGK
jgi:predicted amidohydrolase